MPVPPPPQSEPELCPVCGTLMATADGETYCPKCSSEINWEPEDDDDEPTE